MDGLSRLQIFLLSVQISLWGSVRPQLRAVKVDLGEGGTAVHWFYYDGEISESDKRVIDIITSRANYGLARTGIESYILRWDYPQMIPEQGYYVYLRNETSNINEKLKIDHDIYFNKNASSIYNLHLLSMHALLGKVRPNLRSIKIDINEAKNIVYFWFYFDGEVSAEDKQIVENICTEVIAFFSSEYCLEVNIDRLDYPQKIPSLGGYLYKRDESIFGEEEVPVRESDESRRWDTLTVNPVEMYDSRLPFTYNYISLLRKSLLGKIIPRLRAIKFATEPSRRRILLWVYFDGEILEEDLFLVEAALARTSKENYTVKIVVERLDFPSKIPTIGHYLFLREESLPKVSEEIARGNTEGTTSEIDCFLHFKTQQVLYPISPYLGLPKLKDIISYISNAEQVRKKDYEFYKAELQKRTNAEVIQLWDSTGSSRRASNGQCDVELFLALNLRAVQVDIDIVKKKLYFWFFFHERATASNRKRAKEVIQKIKKQFNPKFTHEGYMVQHDFPKQIPVYGAFAYLREGEKEVPEQNNLLDAPVIYLFFQVVHEALIGRIKPHLRAVKIDVNEFKKNFHFWFYYDEALSEEDRLISKAIVDYSRVWPNFSYVVEIERLDYPHKIPHIGRYIYRRHETDFFFEPLGR